MNESRLVLIIGTGCQARVVAEILRSSDRPVAGLVAPPDALHRGEEVQGQFLSWEEALKHRDECEVIIGVGDNALRQRLQKAARDAGFSIGRAVHPSAVIGKDVRLEPGTVVSPGAILVLNVSVGEGAIINTGARIDHDCVISPFCHIGPGAILAGTVRLGERVFVGAGATIINNVKVGADTVIGAGAVVVRDLPEGVVAAGVPARIMRDVEV